MAKRKWIPAEKKPEVTPAKKGGKKMDRPKDKDMRKGMYGDKE